jgi:hypothetical protein
MQQRALPHAAEDIEIEEVHGAKHEENDADLRAQNFNGGVRSDRLFGALQGEHDETDIDEIEADEQEVIDGVGKRLVAVEGIDEKNAAMFVKRMADPNGQGDTDAEVDDIGGDDGAHISLCFGFSVTFENMWQKKGVI